MVTFLYVVEMQNVTSFRSKSLSELTDGELEKSSLLIKLRCGHILVVLGDS